MPFGFGFMELLVLLGMVVVFALVLALVVRAIVR